LKAIAWTAIAGLAAVPAVAAGDAEPALTALGADPEAARAAVAELRREGPAGVEALRAVEPAADAPEHVRWERALDAVCAQRDGAASGLYWYTDLDAARAAAGATGRPILSLRLLGRLDEEVSCANSRFFRTALYPDSRVRRVLGERFVLHWQSERPVPRLTIDFGDGRTLEGTITGNSVHYVLDSRGRVVDALPGLYAPGMFLDVLGAAERAALELARLDDDRYSAGLARYHAGRLAEAERELDEAGAFPGPPSAWLARFDGPPPAIEAAELAMTKGAFERPVVRAVSRTATLRKQEALEAFAEVGLLEAHRDRLELGLESRVLLLRKHRPADRAEAFRVIEGFEKLVALDTVRNEFLLHAAVHRWLAEPGPAVPTLDELDSRVYAELFLTPDSDPWLGLVSPETYLALEPPGPAPSAEPTALALDPAAILLAPAAPGLGLTAGGR
jgi:hypothetical protein